MPLLWLSARPKTIATTAWSRCLSSNVLMFGPVRALAFLMSLLVGKQMFDNGLHILLEIVAFLVAGGDLLAFRPAYW